MRDEIGPSSLVAQSGPMTSHPSASLLRPSGGSLLHKNYTTGQGTREHSESSRDHSGMGRILTSPDGNNAQNFAMKEQINQSKLAN